MIECCVYSWLRRRAENVRTDRAVAVSRVETGGPQILLIPRGGCGVERGACRQAILPRTHIQLPDHAHLQVLGRGDVAVPKIGARIGSQVVVGGASSDVDRPSRIRHAVIVGGGVRVAVEVHGMLFEQVRAHDHANVAQGKEKFVVLVKGDQWRGYVSVQHSDGHDSGWVGDCAVQADGAARVIRGIADGAVAGNARRPRGSTI